MDSNGKLKTLFSPSIRFLRWFTLIISLILFIDSFFYPQYPCMRDAWKISCASFILGLFFALAQYFGNSDRWLYEKYRPIVFTVLGFIEMPLAFLWTVLHIMVCYNSLEFLGSPAYERNYDRSIVISKYVVVVLAPANLLGFAFLTIGLARWVFVRTQILEKIRSGFSQVDMKWPVSDKAFSIRGNFLRFLALMAAIGSATLGYIFCNPVGINVVWIVSVASCVISSIYILGDLIGLLQKLEHLPLLSSFFLASEVLINVIMAILNALIYAVCINEITYDDGVLNEYEDRLAAFFIMLLAEFNVIMFAVLTYSLIRRAFIGRKLAEKCLPLPAEIDSDPQDSDNLAECPPNKYSAEQIINSKSDGKLKMVFSPSIRFLRWFTLTISLILLIDSIFYPISPVMYDNWQISCWSFVSGQFFALAQCFGNNDKLLNKKYRPAFFCVLGLIEIPLAFLWTGLFVKMTVDSGDFLRFEAREYFGFPMYIAVVLARLNFFGFASLTIGLVRWVFFEMKIRQRIRIGFSQVEVKWPVSNEAYSISGNVLRILTLIASTVTATLGLIYCESIGSDAIWIISLTSCIISLVYISGNLKGLSRKMQHLPFLVSFFLASEIIANVIMAIFHILAYAIFVEKVPSSGMFGGYDHEIISATLITLLVEFNLIVFAILTFILIRHAFAARKLAENFPPLSTEIDVDPKDPLNLNVQQ